MKEKTEVNDINENIYNFKKKNDFSYETIGLTPEIIKEISAQKNEPSWMLDIRLKALETFNKLNMPTWGPDLSELDMSKIKSIEVTNYYPGYDMSVTDYNEVP